MTDKVDQELKALKAALAVSGGTQLSQKDKDALRGAVTVIHHEVESMQQTGKQFPASVNPDLQNKYSATERALNNAIASGKLDAEALKGLKDFTRDHERAAATVQRGNDVTRVEARTR